MSNATDTPESAVTGFGLRIWMVFASVRLSIVILLLLALVSILGTLIPQSPGGHTHDVATIGAKIVHLLQLYDMYHAWWFRLLLVLFALNLTVCTFERLPGVWKIVTGSPKTPTLRRVEAMGQHVEMAEEGDLESLTSRAVSLMKSVCGRAVVTKIEEGCIVSGEAGRWTRVGVYVVHIGILVLLAGGLIGSLFGFSGYANVPEGESISTIQFLDGRPPMKLPFEIRCDEFEASFYDTGTPKEYRSRLTLIENGEAVVSKDIRVNRPLSRNGIRMFQSSYGIAAVKNVEFYILVEKTREEIHLSADMGEVMELPRGFGKLQFMDFMNNFRLRNHRLGESFLVRVQEPGKEIKTQALPIRHPGFDANRERPYTIVVKDFEKAYYTGLQVNKDPGVGLVYAGFVFMLVGCWIAFFMSHRSWFVLIREKKGGATIRIAATANRNKPGVALALKKAKTTFEKTAG